MNANITLGRKIVAALTLAAFAGASPNARAATVGIWNTTSGEWTNPTNWTTNPLFPSQPDDVAYFQGGIQTLTIGSPISLGVLTFDNAAVTLNPTTGGSITLSSTTGQAAILLTSTPTGSADYINVPVNLGSDLTISSGSFGILNFSGPFFGSGNLVLNGLGYVSLHGNDAAWNPASITINSGTLTSNSGYLTAFGDPNTGSITVNPGGVLDLRFSTLTPGAFSKTLMLNGSGVNSGAIIFGSNNNVLLESNIFLNGPTTFFGTSAGTLSLGALNSTSNAATLQGTGPLIKTGSGILQLNVPATFTGGTQVNGGTLTISSSGSLVNTGPVVINAGGYLSLQRPVGADPSVDGVNPNAITLAGGTLGIASDIPISNFLANSPANGVISLDTATPFTAGGTNLIDLSTLPTGSLIRLTARFAATMPNTLQIIPDATHTIHFTGTFEDDVDITDVNSIPTNVDFTGSSIMVDGTSSYSGVTTVRSGSLWLGNSGGLGSPLSGTYIQGGTIAIGAPTAEPLFLQSGGAVIFSSSSGTGPISVAGGSLILGVNWTGAISLTSGALAVAGPSASSILDNGGNVYINARSTNLITLNSGTVTLNSLPAGTITANGGLVKVSFAANYAPQSLILDGAKFSLTTNNFPEGAISPASTSAVISIDTPAPFTSDNFFLLDLSTVPAIPVSLGSSITTSIDPRVTLRPDSNHTFTFGGQGATGTLTVSPVVADYLGVPASVVVIPSTLIIFATANTYTGTTTVNGTLQINNPAGLGSASGADTDGTTVNPGGFLFTGNGVTLDPEKITLKGGTLNVSSSGPVSIIAHSDLLGSYSGPISGSADFYTDGSLTLSGTNSFTGHLTVSNARVTVNSPLGLGDPNTPLYASWCTLTLTAPVNKPIDVMSGSVYIQGQDLQTIVVNSGTTYINQGGPTNYQAYGGTIVLNDSANIQTGTISLQNASLTALQSNNTSAPILVSGSSAVGLPNAELVTGTGNLTLSGQVYSLNFQSRLSLNSPAIQNATVNGLISSLLGGSISSLSATGNLVQHAGNLNLNTATIQGDISVFGGTLNLYTTIVHGDVAAFGGNLAIITALTANSLTVGSLYTAGELSGPGDLTLVDPVLHLGSGSVNFTGNMHGITDVDVNAPTYQAISAFPPSYTGNINLQSGTLMMFNTLQGMATINVAASGAVLQLFTAVVTNPIHLNNAVGFGDGVGLSIQGYVHIENILDIGTAGAIIGGSGPTFFDGTLTGGGVEFQVPLTVTSRFMNNTGPTTFDSATTLQSQGAFPDTPIINISPNASLTLDNTTNYVPDRIPDSTQIIMNGGSFVLGGFTLVGSITQETLGNIVSARGVNYIGVYSGTLGAPVQLVVSSISRSVDSVVDFLYGGLWSLGYPDGQIVVQNQPQTFFMGGGFIYGSSESNFDFVKYTANGVTPFISTDYFTGPESAWTDGLIPNIPAGSTLTLTASRTIAAIKIGDPPSFSGALDLANNTLNVTSGGVVAGKILGGPASRLTAGGQSASAGLFLHSASIISANITDNPGPDGQYDPIPGGPLDADNGSVSVVLNGNATFSGVNTYTGTTFINDFWLRINSSASLGSGPVYLTRGELLLNASGTYHTGPVTMAGNDSQNFIHGPGVLSPASLAIEAGEVDILAGNGPLTKTSNGSAHIFDVSQFTGPITVLAGSLSLYPSGFSIPSGSTLSNSLVIQNGSLVLPFNSTVSGNVTLGQYASLYAYAGDTTFIPASLTVSPGATFFVSGLLTLGPGDPFTDSADPSRHLNLVQTSSINFLPGNTYNVATLSGYYAGAPANVTLVADSIQSATRNFTVSGAMRLRPGDPTLPSIIGSLTMSSTATFDISNHSLIIDPSSYTPSLQSILQNLIATAKASNWTGPGITSSTVAADATTSTPTTLALVSNSMLQFTEWDGQPIDENAFIITRALQGDTNLDGSVTLNDLVSLEQYYNFPQDQRGWAQGNTTGNGNFADLVALEQNYGANLPSVLASPNAAVASASTSPAPEPSSLAIALLTAPWLLRRRNRKADGDARLAQST